MEPVIYTLTGKCANLISNRNMEPIIYILTGKCAKHEVLNEVLKFNVFHNKGYCLTSN